MRPWLALGSGLGLLAALPALAGVNGLRFARRVRQEAQVLWIQAEAPRIVDRGRLERLPAPVSRYLTRALGARERALQTARLRHGGEFRTTAAAFPSCASW